MDPESADILPFLDPEIAEMVRFLDPEIVEKVDKSYILKLLVLGTESTKGAQICGTIFK